MALSNKDFLELNVLLLAGNKTLEGTGVALFVSTDDTLGTLENKYRVFETFGEVEEVYDSTDEPFLALDKWFSQTPLPKKIIVARYLPSAVSAILEAAVNTKTAVEFAAITSTSSFNLTVNGLLVENINPDFSGVSDLATVATILSAAITDVTVTFNAVSGRFEFVSDTTGAASTLSFGLDASAPLAVALADFMGLKETDGAILNQGDDATVPVSGSLAIINDAPLSDLIMFDNTLLFSTFTRQNKIDISSAFEAQKQDKFKMVFWGDDDAANLLLNDTSVLGFDLKQLALTTPSTVYSSLQDYKHVAAPAYLSSINFDATNGMRSLKFSALVDTIPDALDETGKQALDINRVNYYAEFASGNFYAQGSQPKINVTSTSIFALYAWFVPEVNFAIANILSSRLIGNDVEGQAAVEGVIGGVSNQAVRNGFIIDGSTASVVPVSAAMKADIIAVTGNADFSGFLPAATGYLLFATPFTQQTQQQRDNEELPPFFLWAKFDGFVGKIILNATFEN